MTTLDEYLTVAPQGQHRNVWSCFPAALRDARKATGRDQETGAIVNQVAQGNWLGAIGYLCLFDQLGTTVGLATVPPAVVLRINTVPGVGAERAFRSTLYQFSDVTERDSATLWALRNSLAHNYSLVNRPPNPNRTELLHRFVLIQGGNTLVTYPAQAWNGAFPGHGGQTIVSVTQLSNVGEAVAGHLLQEHENGNVVSNLPVDELHSRFFLAHGQLGLNIL